MLSQEILTTLKAYTENLSTDLSFLLQTGDHSKRAELFEFLNEICSVSPRLNVKEGDQGLRSGVSFSLLADNRETGIVFSGIPSGHEFNSLVLAMLQAAGTPIKIDNALKAIIENVRERLHFEVFVSLSCQNCPDVVQALNEFALLNPNISTEMIDGGLFQDIIEKRGIQGVPSVFVNDDLFANGKIDRARLIDLLIDRDPSIRNVRHSETFPIQDVAVGGGGPAGVSAAIYAARKGLKVTLITDRLGGQLKDTMAIENFISVSQTTGTEMVGNLARHMSDYDINLKDNLRVESIENGVIKSLLLSSGQEIKTRALIIASGAQWRELGVPGERENIGNGVAYCPHCDGPFFKGKDVAVIGGGNSGIEAAIDLSGMARFVSVFEFLPELKADQILIDQATSRSNINIITNVATQAITASSGKVDGIDYQDRDTGERHHQTLEGVFIQIGLVPNSKFVRELVQLSPWGEVVIDEKCKTSEEGVFACGDVTTVPYKQILIAMGEGSKASLSAFEYLLSQENETVNAA